MAALEQSLAAAKGQDGGKSSKGDDADLGEQSRDELYERAQKAGVEGRSSMSKKQLVDARSKR
jgi:DNA end-binding protein Ku